MSRMQNTGAIAMSYVPPLHVHIVYDARSKVGDKYADLLADWLFGDAEAHGVPHARIPVFVWTAAGGQPRPTCDWEQAERSAVFLLVDDPMVADRAGWSGWLDDCLTAAPNDRLLVVPCSFTRNFANLHAGLAKIHAIRLDKKKKAPEGEFLLEATFILGKWYRQFFKNSEQPTLFISHAKRTAKTGPSGRDLAIQIKKFAEKRPLASLFFDEVKIVGGEEFANALTRAVSSSVVVVLLTDLFSSRYWCAKEAHLAKFLERPMLVVDALTIGETSSLPYFGRLRTIHWDVSTADAAKNKATIRCIVVGALLELLRNTYDIARLQAIGNAIGLPTRPLARAPELGFLRAKPNDVLLYPGPPLPRFELETIEVCRPDLQILTGMEALAGWGALPATRWLTNRRIALSTSFGGCGNGVREGMLKSLFTDLCEHLLHADAELAYGGDLRIGGYTELLQDLASAASDAETPFPEDSIWWYMAWPLKDDITAKQKAGLSRAINRVELDCPSGRVKRPTAAPSQDTHAQRLTRVRATSEMRRRMAVDCDARVFVSGQRQGISPWPGLVEELETFAGKPIFLLGGFGGITADLAEAFRTKDVSAIRVPWKASPGKDQDFESYYADRYRMIDFAREPGLGSKMEGLVDRGFAALNNGLDDAENECLGKSKDPTEVIVLVLRGLWRSLGVQGPRPN